MNLDQITDAVLEKLSQQKPRALLIGNAPDNYHNYNYVNQKPYDAIVLGILQPGELLRMPCNEVCCALLEERPVYYYPVQPWKKAGTARALCRELTCAEQRLYHLGVLPLEMPGQLLTAGEARAMLRLGQKPQPDRRMTPLARDILEGREP